MNLCEPKTQLKKHNSLHIFFGGRGQHPKHIEVPRQGVKSELQLPANTTAAATPDPSHVCNLHHSSRQCRITNLLTEARDRTCILMDISRIRFTAPQWELLYLFFF